MTVWNKLDSSLTAIYLDYLHESERGAAASPRHHSLVPENGRLNVSLHYTGDLAAIEAIGFETTSRSKGGVASGNISLENIPALTEHSGVLRMSYGRRPKTMLDVSVPDINVRGQVWTLAGSVFTGLTGEGVIIGIIDTGIDFKHPFFRKQANTTRILRIWDQGLPSGSPGQSSPAANLLEDPAGVTYGVEYTEDMINQAIQGSSDAVRHRDCDGHGTHVASIAAGDGRDEYKYVGVAPKASLIVVKYLSLENDAPVNHEQRFRDAVSYILHVAGATPVVINLSLGDDTSPHDGITDGEDFLTDTFDLTTSQVFVAAAGNSAGFRRDALGNRIHKNQHARLDFPVGGGTTDIPLQLIDTRTDRMEYKHCRPEDETGPISVMIYYPFGKTISVSLELPDNLGTVAGPALGGAPVSNSFSGRRYTMQHSTESVNRRVGGTFQRNSFELVQTPNGELQHYQGTYILTVTTTDQMTAHLYCDQGRGDFRVDDSEPFLDIVTIEDRFLIGTYGGADNILTVASYGAHDSDGGALAASSSRGPLASYEGPAPPAKPDIAAPGLRITAAMSDFAQRTTCKPNTTTKSGTSMASPHVAGAAALLLHHTPLLTTAEIISTLKTHLRAVTAPETTEEVGAGRIDVKQAIDSLP